MAESYATFRSVQRFFFQHHFHECLAMRIKQLSIAISLALALVTAAAVAAEKGSGGSLYRYKNDKGVMVMDSSIPPEYAAKGYQILTRSGQLLETVAPVAVITPEEAKRQREQHEYGEQMIRKDSELRKLYSAPQDAERLRDRQIEAITLKIEYAKSQLSQLVSKRKGELEQAARLERQGTAVPPAMRENIERLNRQINEQDAQVKALQADSGKMRTDFEPIIERLKVIYPHKVNPDNKAGSTVASPSAAPSAAPAPAVAR